MKINFDYDRKKAVFTKGYILKGKLFRCNYVKFRSLYRDAAKGTEYVELYSYEPKDKPKGSCLIIHGLGTRNIKFLMWLGSTLASFNVSCNLLILPYNYTRVAKGSVSGKNYVYPDMEIMYKTWEHAIVDLRTTLDYMEDEHILQDKNCTLGYCLGGMLNSILSSIDSRTGESILLNTGGYFPKIIHECPVGKFAQRMFSKGYSTDYNLHDKYKLYNIYDNQLSTVKKLSLDELLNSEDIHPLFKIDPLSYAHLLNKKRVTFIDGIYDETLPIISRSLLYKELNGSTRYLLPMTHGSTLLFEFFIAQYILLKLGIPSVPNLKHLVPPDFKIPLVSDFLDYIK